MGSPGTTTARHKRAVRNFDDKRTKGQFFTTGGNPFDCRPFAYWAKRAGLPEIKILEPFAGKNSLIEHLDEVGQLGSWASFDIEPQSKDVEKRDTLKDFPQGFKVCVTNPPWLAKNSATFRGLPFPETDHDDIYKLALTRCLENCEYVAALIPESFIRANLHITRLHTFVSLTAAMFEDTAHPVGLALFDPKADGDPSIYSGKTFVGKLSDLQKKRPPQSKAPEIRFNEPDGNLGLIALDNTVEPSIRFCEVDELRDYKVSDKCRHITKLQTPKKVNIRSCNDLIAEFRDTTKDVLMTCYRGIRKDGMYRRRLDWVLARDIICYAG